jgi:maltose/maltodextrin transport system substrate-binding protein
MIREFLLTVSIMAVVSCSAVSEGSDHEGLTAKASAEYAQPLRPGGVDGSPFWNIHSTRFTYAPAFDFKTVDGAESYRFTLTHENGEEHVFVAASPRESLSSVWNDVLPGNVTLVVEGLDSKGEVVGLAGERKFTRAYPFVAKEDAPARPYREAALKACLYVHNMPAVQHWKNSVTPDMSYPYNAYV